MIGVWTIRFAVKCLFRRAKALLEMCKSGEIPGEGVLGEIERDLAKGEEIEPKNGAIRTLRAEIEKESALVDCVVQFGAVQDCEWIPIDQQIPAKDQEKRVEEPTERFDEIPAPSTSIEFIQKVSHLKRKRVPREILYDFVRKIEAENVRNVVRNELNPEMIADFLSAWSDFADPARWMIELAKCSKFGAMLTLFKTRTGSAEVIEKCIGKIKSEKDAETVKKQYSI